MVIGKKIFTLTALSLFAATALAQESEQELQERMLEAEMRLAEQELQEAARIREVEKVVEIEEVEVRMREAERRLAEAARQVADLSMAQLPRVERIERIIRSGRGPVLGVTIGSDDNGDPVAGVEILGVSPGGAAGEAGLRAGDVITSVNGETLTADSGEEANDKLLDFMQGVEEGDELEIEYLRNGKSASVEVQPRAMANAFAFRFDGENFSMPDVPVAPNVHGFENFVWMGHGDGFGDMELVKLTERLGSYFGTTEGLLVVRAPESEELELEDGDVILNIDGRTPNSVSHAMRILGSYQAGEELKIEIMRDKRKRTIEVEIPDNRQSFIRPGVAPPVHAAPPVHPVPAAPPVVIGKERT